MMRMGSGDERSTELLHSQAHIWNQTFSFINSASLKCAVQLGIPDAIHRHGKPMTIDQLVAALSIKPAKVRSVYRLMRVLVHSGFVVQENVDDQDGYVLTPASLLLLKDEPLNARAFLLLAHDPIITQPWNILSDWFHNDDPTAFHTTYGKSFWEYQADKPRPGNLFDEAMASDSRLIVRYYVFKIKKM
jgi:trans-resveratrol di-O-methyltransferase